MQATTSGKMTPSGEPGPGNQNDSQLLSIVEAKEYDSDLVRHGSAVPIGRQDGMKTWICCLAGTGLFALGFALREAVTGRDAVCVASAPRPTASGGDGDLDEATRHFTYKGQPIHPKLIQQFEGWFSDLAPSVIKTVDVSAARQARNEYNSDDVQKQGKIVRRRYGADAQEYAYEHLGILSNGVHVLRTIDSGGGSGIFENLMFVRFHVSPSGPLLMSVIDRRGIGDRANATIAVQPDQVSVRYPRGADDWHDFVVRADELKEW